MSLVARHPSFFLQWILATLIGAGIGWTAGIYGAASTPTFNSNVVWLICGLCIGLAQWVVIRAQIKKAWQWIVASVIGWLVAFNIGSLVFGMMTDLMNGPGLSMFEAALQANQVVTGLASLLIVWFLIGAAGGAVVGGTQWFVLRQYYPNAAQWVLANALGWGIGLGFSWFGALLVFMLFAQVLANFAPAIAMGTPIATISGGLSGAVTGYILLKIIFTTETRSAQNTQAIK